MLASWTYRWRAPPAMLSALWLACTPTRSYRDLDIHATNYAFQVSSPVPAGLTAIRFVNDGTTDHELQLFQFRPGITPELALRLLARDSFPDNVGEGWGSILGVTPGHAALARILVPLVHGGLYGLLCELRNGPGLPVHARMGMVALLRVE